MSELNDNQLIIEINEGSHQAFGVLVRRHSRYFYAIAYRFLGDRVMAEDMVQQAFLKLWEFPYKYDASRGASFKTWFSQIIINLCIDYKRKNRQFFEDYEEIQVPSNDKEASTILYDRQMKAMLEKAINKLPISQQKAINLGFYQDIPYDEVAVIMKTTSSAVKSLIMRAKENLKKTMEGINHAK